MNKIDNINILIVDDRPENLFVLESLLENMDCNILKATSGNEALSLMLDYDFALVLLDVQMPGMDGFETAELMRCNRRTRYIPIIFVTAISKEQKCIFKGYEVGAVDYLFKPIEPIVLQSKVKIFIELHSQKILLEEQSKLLELRIKELTELRADNCKLETLSGCDGLTGIPNRRRFDDHLQASLRNNIRSGKSLSLIMADIDYFKLYNDNYGHLMGDDALTKVARAIASAAKRPMDLAARYGGEEFSVILPETDNKIAVSIAEEIRNNIESLAIQHEYSKAAPFISLSLGIATIGPESNCTAEELIDKADKCLYEAKKSGRNTLISYDKDSISL